MNRPSICMLAQTYDGTIPPHAWVDTKIDGLRCIARKCAGVVTLQTRSGATIDTLPSIVRAIADAPIDNVVLDGEVCGQDWGDTQHVVASTGARHDDRGMVLHVFDCVPIETWDSRDTSAPYSRRLLDAMRAVRTIASERVTMVQGRGVCSAADVDREYAAMQAAGFEGCMIKDLDAPYCWGRTAAVLKRKTCLDWTATIVAVHEGRGRMAGMMGALEVRLPGARRDPEGDGFALITTRIGCGYTDAMRREMWARRDDLIGTQCDVAGQELTALDRIRNPRFLRMRAEE